MLSEAEMMLKSEQLFHLIYLVQNHISFIQHTGDAESIEKDEILLKDLNEQLKHQKSRERLDQKHTQYIYDTYKTEEDLGVPIFENGYCKESSKGCPYLKYIGVNGLDSSTWACRKYGLEIRGNIFNMPAQRQNCIDEFGE